MRARAARPVHRGTRGKDFLIVLDEVGETATRIPRELIAAACAIRAARSVSSVKTISLPDVYRRSVVLPRILQFFFSHFFAARLARE